MLLGDDGDEVEQQLRNFVAKRECWVKEEPKKSAKKKLADPYSITVDYALTLDRMIAAGQYDWKNGDINSKNFQIKGEGKLELKPQLIHFDHSISSDEVERKIGELNPPMRPANLEELLAFGAKYPDLQRQFPIVAPKAEASIDGGRNVAYLDHAGSRRGLDLDWRDNDWPAHYRFLALPKLSGS